jgi:hypothetical protein
MGVICNSCNTYNPGGKKNCLKCNAYLYVNKNYKKCPYCNFLNPKRVQRCIKCSKKFGVINQVKIIVSGLGDVLEKAATTKKIEVKRKEIKPTKKEERPSSLIEWVKKNQHNKTDKTKKPKIMRGWQLYIFAILWFLISVLIALFDKSH